MAGTALTIIAVIILIVGAFVSLHFWFHVFLVLSEAAASISTPSNQIMCYTQLLSYNT